MHCSNFEKIMSNRILSGANLLTLLELSKMGMCYNRAKGRGKMATSPLEEKYVEEASS